MRADLRGFHWLVAVAILATAVGCTAPADDPPGRDEVVFTDQWSATYERCDWAAHRAELEALGLDANAALDWHVGDQVPLYPSEDCVDAVLADLKIDLESMLAADELDDPYGLTRGLTHHWTTLGSVLRAARDLFLMDYGPIEELEPTLLVSETYVDTMRSVAANTDSDLHAAALYNFVTSTTLRMVSGHDRDDCDQPFARFDPRERLLIVCHPAGGGYWGSTFMTSILVHEARHFEVRHHVPCVWDPDLRVCDDDLDGAHGFGLAALLERLRRAPDEMEEHRIDGWYFVEGRVTHINSMWDEDGKPPPWLYDHRTDISEL